MAQIFFFDLVCEIFRRADKVESSIKVAISLHELYLVGFAWVSIKVVSDKYLELMAAFMFHVNHLLLPLTSHNHIYNKVFSYNTTMDSIEDLQQIGLTEGELKVYRALLKIGESTKTALVKEAGVTPANLYDIANRLAEKGIVSIVMKNGVKHFSAAHPRHLLDFIDEKKKEIEKERSIVERLLPSLTAAFEDQQDGLCVEIYTGWKGFSTIFEDLLSECGKKDTNYVFGAAIGERPAQADAFFLRYSKMRKRKGIPLKIIFTEDLRTRSQRISWFLENAETRFLVQHSTTEVMLYRNTVVILVLAAKPLAIRIRDQSVADSFKAYFREYWKRAKKKERNLTPRKV